VKIKKIKKEKIKPYLGEIKENIGRGD